MISPFYRLSLYVTLAVSALTGSCLLANFLVYEFPGNNYLPQNYLSSALVLLLVYNGIRIMFGKHSRYANISLQLLVLFSVMSLMVFASNAVQFTPNNPIDAQLIRLESRLNIHLLDWMQWIQAYPEIKWLMEWIYDSLPLQMLLVPLFVIVTDNPAVNDNRYRLYIYYLFMLWTVFVGFAVYYFFPTTAPASNLSGQWFIQSQYNTGIKFNQIHHYQPPATLGGGLISFPSFHCIWAILLVYLVWNRPVFRILLAITNFILVLSCVFLGWHYLVDIVGAIMLILLSIWIFYPILKRHLHYRYILLEASLGKDPGRVKLPTT